MSADGKVPEPMVLEVDGFRFDGLAAGPESGELVLLLHGFPQFADAWTLVMGAIAGGGYRVVAVDQRGYSAGARPEEVAEYSVPKLVGDVLGFADALGASRFHLVGHDWGGLVAWKVAAAAPERLRTLSVLATPHPDAFAKAVASDPDQMKKSSYFLLFRAPLHAAELAFKAADAALLRRVYGGKVLEAQVEENVRRLLEGETLTAALNWYRAMELGGEPTGPISVPTLYVWGDEDMALGETAALATADYVGGPYWFERVKGGSHWLVEEMPERIASLLLEQFKSETS